MSNHVVAEDLLVGFREEIERLKDRIFQLEFDVQRLKDGEDRKNE